MIRVAPIPVNVFLGANGCTIEWSESQTPETQVGALTAMFTKADVVRSLKGGLRRKNGTFSAKRTCFASTLSIVHIKQLKLFECRKCQPRVKLEL